MRTATLVIVIAMLAGAGRAAEAPAAGDPAAILRAFFAENDAAKRADLAKQFGAVAPKAWAEVKALLHQAAPFPAMAPGKQPFQTKGDADVPSVNYVLRIPAGYKADAGRAWPLIIGCHGTGGTGDAAMTWLEGLLGADADQYVLACPAAPTEREYTASRANTEYPVRVLQDVRHRVNLDSNRSVLTGVSRGGYAVWGTILFSPGEWAGAAPIASWPLTEARAAGVTLYLPNVLALPIQAHWGENDLSPGQKQGINTFSRDVNRWFIVHGPKNFEGIEYPGQAHGLTLDAEKLRAFFAAARRDPYPAVVNYLFHHLWQGRAYFVRATAMARDEFDFTAPHMVKADTQDELAKAEGELYRKEAAEITALTQGAENTVSVNTRNLAGIEVEVGPEELDFSKPVKVLVNGRLAGGEVKALDWGLVLETARQSYDFERLVGARVKATIPASKR